MAVSRPTLKSAPTVAPNRRFWLLAGGLLVVGVVVLVVLGLRRPPQMGADEAVFDTVDALFTAVTARDPRLLDQCERSLHAHRDAGKLPHDASVYLDGVIGTARGGQWETAAHRLYQFMQVQRRDGAGSPPRPKKAPGHGGPARKGG